MDIVLILVLLIIAVSVVLGKPVQITITHKIDRPPFSEVDALNAIQKQSDDDKEAMSTMDSVIQSLHEIMGVNEDGKDNNRT